MATLKYWLWLSTRKGLRPEHMDRLLEHFGTPEAAYFADPAEYGLLEGLPQAPGPSGPPPWVAPAAAALLSAMLLAALTALSAVLLHNKKKRARARRKGSFRL